MKQTPIPRRIRGESLIRLHPNSKRPVTDVYDTRPLEDVREWVINGGNVGVHCDGDLVVVDIDEPPFGEIATEFLPWTFTVSTPGGEHRYLRCSDWDRNTSVTDEQGEIGSVRTDGHYVVAPPSTNRARDSYGVGCDDPIATVRAENLSDLIDTAKEAANAGGGGGGGGSAGGSRPEPAGREGLDKLDRLITHDDAREDVRRALRDPRAPHDTRVWLVGFLNEAVGVGEGEILEIIDQFNDWENYDPETTERQVRSVVR